MNTNKTKPINADDAIKLVSKRRQASRDYYARMRDDARRYREAQQSTKAGATDKTPARAKGGTA